MSGKPAARIGDSTSKGKIISGSATVLIGDAAEGRADRCSACEPAVGGPVNPLLGAKLLPAETDFVLPAPAPFAFTRSYLSRDARVSCLGQGWSIPGEGLGLEVHSETTVLIDAQGRRITFGALAPGEARYSPTETLWIRRGGPVVPQTDALAPWTGRWAAVAEARQHAPHRYFVLAGSQYFELERMGQAGPFRLAARFDRNGYRTEFNWHPDGLLQSVRDSAGRYYRFAYHRFNGAPAHDRGIRLAGVALAPEPGGALLDADAQADWLVRYGYTDEADLATVTDRSGHVVRRFEWAQHLLVAHAAPGGIEVRYEWDRLHAHGRVVAQRETDGLARSFVYHPDHTTVTDSLGRTETYHFTGEGPEQRWRAHTRADGSRIEFHYDGFGRRVASVDALERRTTHRLDGQGRLMARILPERLTWRYRLEPECGDVLAVEEPDELSWQIERDARGNPLQIAAPDGATTRYAYEQPALPDRPTSITDARGGVRRLAWNSLGQLTAHTDCSGHTSRFEYDGEGRLARETNALGETTRHRHDALGRVIETLRPDDTRIAYQYDPLGRLVRVTRPEGHTDTLVWDRFGRLAAFMDAGGLTQRHRHDAAGRLIELVNENEAKSRFEYDAMDRLVTEVGFDGRTQHYAYNAAGELVARTEASVPGEPVTRFEHDALGRLTARHLPATEHSPAITEHFAWRGDGQLAGFTSPTAEVRFIFDASGRPINEFQTHADGWDYACAHRHGVLGQIESSTYGTAPAVDWLTYGSGHLHGVRLEGLALDFERDPAHREIERRLRRDEGAGASPALIEARAYTALGQLACSRVDVLAHSRREPAAGAGAGAGAPVVRDYRYDAHDQLIAIADSARPERAIAYAYDATGRLIASRHGETGHDYRFDAAGNRLDPVPAERRPETADEAWARIVRERIHDPDFNPLGEGHINEQGAECWPGNRIARLAARLSRYDGAGNLVERSHPDGTRMRLGYDGAHRLVWLERTDPGGAATQAFYAYDALSRRIAKTVTDPDGRTTTTRYGWDGERLVAEATDTSTTTVVFEPNRFVPLLRIEQPNAAPGDDEEQAEQALLADVGRLLATHGIALPDELKPATPPARVSVFLTDHLGTPLELLDREGHTEWEASPDDWAAVRDEKGLRQPIRFQGQWADEESGLYYNRYRYYDPSHGRYVTQDPIGLRGGINVYEYALSQPNRYVDPNGLTSLCPTSPPVNNGNWIPYKGNPHVFHCGYEGYLENRPPTPERPTGECFYDESGSLVDDNHPYAGCKGTPNQYGADDWWAHTFNDSGGIWNAGGPAFEDSVRHKIEKATEAVRNALPW